MKNEYRDILDLLFKLNTVYRLKSRRLRHMRLATVNREITSMRDSFFDIWEKRGNGFSLKNPGISCTGIEILKGMFGEHDEARAILEGDMMLLACDRERFRGFLAGYVTNGRARENLYALVFGEKGESMEQYALRQVPYLEKYLPTFTEVDSGPLEDLVIGESDRDNIWYIIQAFDDICDNLRRDINLYRYFKRDLTRLYSESSRLEIVGYGEISTVMEVSRGHLLNENLELRTLDESRWIWKKMPPFPSLEDVREFDRIYYEYREILVNDIGIIVPRQMIYYFSHEKHYVVYAGQEKLNTEFVCNRLIREMKQESACALFARILEELKKVYRFNSADGPVSVGFDGQLSNWVLLTLGEYTGDIADKDMLAYIDTSSPLYRVNGVEQINTSILLKTAPSFLRLVLRLFFVKDVVDRYYDTRSVIIDLIANLYKEKRPDLISPFIEIANEFIMENRVQGGPLHEKEIADYYSTDAFIWRFFQFSKKTDKFIIEKILRRKYTYRLPGKIER